MLRYTKAGLLPRSIKSRTGSALGPNDRMTIETEEGNVYEVDLTKTWEPAEIIPVSDTTEKHSEGT